MIIKEINLLFDKFFNILRYTFCKDKITKEIDNTISTTKTQQKEYDNQRKKIVEEMIKFYRDRNNYTDGDLQKRKSFILSERIGFCEFLMDHLINSYKAFFTVLFTSFFNVFFLSKKVIIEKETLDQINSLTLSVFTSVGVFLALTFVSIIIFFVRNFRGIKYRYYSIIELEVSIIDTLLEKYNDEIKRKLIS